MTGSAATGGWAGEEAGSAASLREETNAGSRTVERLGAGSGTVAAALGAGG